MRKNINIALIENLHSKKVEITTVIPDEILIGEITVAGKQAGIRAGNTISY